MASRTKGIRRAAGRGIGAPCAADSISTPDDTLVPSGRSPFQDSLQFPAADRGWRWWRLSFKGIQAPWRRSREWRVSFWLRPLSSRAAETMAAGLSRLTAGGPETSAECQQLQPDIVEHDPGSPAGFCASPSQNACRRSRSVGSEVNRSDGSVSERKRRIVLRVPGDGRTSRVIGPQPAGGAGREESAEGGVG